MSPYSAPSSLLPLITSAGFTESFIRLISGSPKTARLAPPKARVMMMCRPMSPAWFTRSANTAIGLPDGVATSS